MRALVGDRPTVCTLAGHCIGRHFGVNVNGDVYHCDRYVTDRDYLLGNVRGDSFADIFDGPGIARLRERNERRLLRYEACNWKPVCNGGCPHDAYISERSDGLHDVACCGNRELIAHIAGRVLGDLSEVAGVPAGSTAG